MTDERPPEGALPPDPDFAPGAPGASATPPPPPPPLAPYANPAAAAPAPPPQPPAAWGAPPAPQPAVAWGAPAAAAVPAKGKRTMLAAIAGILLLIGGIGGILIGLLIVVLGGAFATTFGDFPGMQDIPELNGADPTAFVGTFVAFLGFIIVAYSVAYLLAGIGVIRNSTWARVLGIIVGIISGLIWLPAVTNPGSITSAGGGQGSVITAIVFFAAHAYIVVALLGFWRTKPATG